MKRTGGLLVGLALLAGCQTQSSQVEVTPTPGCTRLTSPDAPADGPPTAIMKDLAAGTNEFLLGTPGKSVARMAEATGSAPPRFGGGRVFFSVRQGAANEEIRSARVGECSVHFGSGTLAAVEPQGRAFVVGDGGRWHLLDAAGRQLAEVIGPSDTWTGDGHLLETTKTFGLAVYDLAGKRNDINLPPGSAPNVPLGASQEIVFTPAGIQTIDVRDGKLAPLAQPLKVQRIVSGSPDGNYVVVIDTQGQPQLVSLRDGHRVRLPTAGSLLGASWEANSKWLALVSVYGGAVLRLSDDEVIDTGPLVVVNW